MSSLEPTSNPASAEAPPTSCVNCGSPEFSARTRIPVCERCRIVLVKYPFPTWVKLAAVLVTALVLLSLALSRERVAESMTLMSARKMAKEQRWQDAYQNYQHIMAKQDHTSNMDMMLAYAEAAVHSGHHEEASRTLLSLSGRSGTSEQIWKADMISGELKRAGRQSPLQFSGSSLPFNKN